MTTWKQFNQATGQPIGGAATTAWSYNAQRGWLSGKTYEGGAAGPAYQYFPSGRMKTQTLARGVSATYAYSAGGQVAAINYSDATPDVTLVRDIRGRLTGVTDGVGIRTFAYTAADEMMMEDFTAGLLDAVTITNQYDLLLRRDRNTLFVGGQQRNRVDLGYDAATGRLATVTKDLVRRARYSFVAGAPGVVEATTFEQLVSNAWQATQTGSRVFDGMDRLTDIRWGTGSGGAGSTTLARSQYGYNDINQRTMMTAIHVR